MVIDGKSVTKSQGHANTFSNLASCKAPGLIILIATSCKQDLKDRYFSLPLPAYAAGNTGHAHADKIMKTKVASCDLHSASLSSVDMACRVNGKMSKHCLEERLAHVLSRELPWDNAMLKRANEVWRPLGKGADK